MYTHVNKLVFRVAFSLCFLSLCAVPARASLTATPGAVNFGNHLMGATPQSIPVTLANNTQRTFTIVAISTSATEFSVAIPQLPVTLTPGQSLTVGLTFTPDSVNSFGGNLGFTTYYGWTVNVPLSGVGIASNAPSANTSSAPSSGQLSFNSVLSFGTVPLGTPGVQTFSVANSGGSNVTISGISFAGQSVSLSGISAGLVIAAGQAIPVTATFSPVSQGATSGLITINSDAANSSATISWTAATPNPAAAVVESVNLSWIASTSDGVTGYNVYRSTVSGGPYSPITSSPVAGTGFVDSTVSSEQTFFYVVTSVAGGNEESAYSSEVSATVP
jgi:hypothetical protein